MNRWTVVFLLLLVFGSGWIWWTQPEPPAEGGGFVPSAQPAVGRPAPDFTLPTLDGGTFTLSDYRGKPVVLNFWATWCGPCQRELPAVQAAADHYDGVVVFAAVDQAEKVETVQAFVEEMGLNVTVPMDGEQLVGEQYAVLGLPTTYFIDENGIIQSIWMGEMNSVILAENIAGMLR